MESTMGWLARIGLAFGVGGATMELAPHAETVFRGSELTGELLLKGGSVDQQSSD